MYVDNVNHTRPGTGKRVNATNKANTLSLRVKPEDKELLREGAELSGQNLTDFVVSKSIEAARNIIENSRVIEMCKRDYEAFRSALDAPFQPPTEKAKLAVAEYNAGKREDGSFDW